MKRRTRSHSHRWRRRLPNWLVDLAGLAGFVAALVGEIHVYGTSEPVVLGLIAVGIAFFGIPSYVRFMRLVYQPEPLGALYRLIEGFRFSIAALAGVVAVAWIQDEGPVHPDRGVFVAAAEIIPVLAIALAIEGRTVNASRSWWAGRGFLVLATFLVFGWGEYNALAVLAADQPTRDRLAWVGGALAMGFASLVILAVIGPVAALEKDDPAGRSQGTAGSEGTSPDR